MGTFSSIILKSEAERAAWSTILRYFWETHSPTSLKEPPNYEHEHQQSSLELQQQRQLGDRGLVSEFEAVGKESRQSAQIDYIESGEDGSHTLHNAYVDVKAGGTKEGA